MCATCAVNGIDPFILDHKIVSSKGLNGEAIDLGRDSHEDSIAKMKAAEEELEDKQNIYTPTMLSLQLDFLARMKPTDITCLPKQCIIEQYYGATLLFHMVCHSHLNHLIMKSDA